MATSREPFLTAKLQGFGTTIFAEMSALAVSTNSVNLGQGFPDTDGPREVLDAAVAAINGGLNQYPPGLGMPVLREAIADHQQRFYGLQYDPATEVLVTAGATEALAGALMGLLDTGDEVVLFEPMYDSYQACIALAGAVAKPVTLRPPDYGFDPAELRAAISPKTKLLLINTPHNPTGKVLDRAELQSIADLALEHDLIVLTDEVYEHLTFDDTQHIPMATLPGMRDRVLSISSGGKTFNTTGWKVGWLCGPAPLVAAARTAKQFLTYVSSGPFQPAIATGLRLPDQYFHDFRADLQSKRDRLLPGLHAAGFKVFPTKGTYFVTVDIRPLRPDGDGMTFCRELPRHCGVVAIPNEVFYANKSEGRHLVRFAFCKRPEVLDEAVTRLKRLG
ncbi:MAG TPA: pyridoxal phosphate-dependent aminotransferase [Ilumatobacteraceae bacterium]|nr:pyridoxal phosphate-dependent aminotransferase [Ilumatobacteraceae bacterium]